MVRKVQIWRDKHRSPVLRTRELMHEDCPVLRTRHWLLLVGAFKSIDITLVLGMIITTAPLTVSFSEFALRETSHLRVALSFNKDKKCRLTR
jgi:hypothetical protein